MSLNIKYRLLDFIKNASPKGVRRWMRSNFSFRGFDFARKKELEKKRSIVDRADFPASKFVLGIIKDAGLYYCNYIEACKTKKISYRVLDIFSDNWIKEFNDSGCDAFLVWPDAFGTMRKAAIDMRLWMLENEMGKLIYPTWKECWLTEYKPRLRDLLQIKSIPHPKSWVFYDEVEAMRFIESRADGESFVVKTATGASGSGVMFANGKKDLLGFCKKFFKKGVGIRVFDFYDRQRGFLFVQEFLKGAKEWRMVRIGDSYFGYRKEVGADGKGSGSHKWSWIDPGEKRLDALREVTEKLHARSMDVDFFELPDGTLLVNECQTVFGCTTPAIQMKVNDVEGRYCYQNGKWVFEPGSFCANFCCDMRVDDLLRQLEFAV